jgi:tetratricopeptide (TPR) repeat protein
LSVSAATAQDCEAILDRAQRAFDMRQFKVAGSELETARPNCLSDRVRIDVSLGQIHYLLGEESEAERSFQAALSLDPKNEEALYALGRLYSMQNRFPEAVERLEAAVRIDPKNYKAWDSLGVSYDALNRDSDALRSFFKALDIVQKDHPTYDWAHADLADFFLRRDQNEKAFQLAAEAAARNPESARDCYLTGKALVRLEKHELSVRWLERAVQLEGQYADALYLLAQTYRKVGRQEDAARALERFKEVSKNRPRR